MFHEVKGNNIVLDRHRKTASWSPIQTGGLVFTETFIQPEHPVTLKLEGTGAVELGIISSDPASLQGKLPASANKLGNYLFLNDVKIHRRSCTMEIKLNAEKKEILSSYGGGQYRQEVDCNLQYWLVADVKYGAVEMKLNNNEDQNEMYKFSDTCGNNIKRLNNPCMANSHRKSPASFCFYHEPACEGTQYVVGCTPRQFQGTVPGRYFVTLYYSHLDPEELRKRNLWRFDVMEQETLQQPQPEQEFIKVEKFEKDDCTGKPILISFSGNRLTYKTSTGKRSSQTVQTRGNNKIWFAFELYGVSATVNVIDGIRGSDAIDSVNPLMEDIPEEVTDSINIPRSNTMNIPCPVPVPAGRSNIDDPVLLADAIRTNFTTLRDSFTVDEFVDNMFEQNLLTQRELTEVGQLCDRSKHQATKWVLMRLSSLPVSKKFMLNALEQTKQSYLCKYFFPNDEKE